jgi:pantoate--beta-alanine ligase
MPEQVSEARRPEVVRTVPDLRERVGRWRREGLRVGLVPTLGALHEGHLSLVRLARLEADRVVVSIFLNPTQFGPHEDLAKYPKQEATDLALLAREGVQLAFVPPVEAMYPPGFQTRVIVGEVSRGLCGDHRPGHFEGVATVVGKLLLQCAPDVAVFGEKDYQQLCVIRRLVQDLDIPVEIRGGPTVRDEAGLALSSRNVYLDGEELARARELNRVLFTLAEQARAHPDRVPELLEAGRAELARVCSERIDYLELRAADSLEPLARLDRPARLLAALHIGSTRLIDNVPVEPDRA